MSSLFYPSYDWWCAGWGECQACVGSYQAVSRQDNCTTCTQGSYCPAGSTAMKPCGAGYFSLTGELRAAVTISRALASQVARYVCRLLLASRSSRVHLMPSGVL